eukprot:gene14238-20210_t
MLVLTDTDGAVKAWTSAGSMGFKNSRKGLPVAAEEAAEELAHMAINQPSIQQTKQQAQAHVFFTSMPPTTAEELARKAIKLGFGSAIVKIKGMGPNRHYAVQSLATAGVRITRIMDVTPTVYNGCRAPKRRRV